MISSQCANSQTPLTENEGLEADPSSWGDHSPFSDSPRAVVPNLCSYENLMTNDLRWS